MSQTASDFRLYGPEPAAGARDWQALAYFGVYRFILALLLTGLSFWEVSPRSLGSVDPDLFRYTAMAYLVLSVLQLVGVSWRRPAFSAQLPVQIFVDIFALTTLMHASGGVTSGFGMLLVVTIAGGSILSGGRVAILFAAIASLCVLAEQLLTSFVSTWLDPNYPHAGMLGAAFFAAAFLAHYSASRLRASEARAAEQEANLADLARLNEHIVQRMQSGVMVVDTQDRFRLSNKSAARLLGLTELTPGRRLADLLPELAQLKQRWEAHPEQPSYVFQPAGSLLTVQVSFAALAEGRDGALMFLEDNAAISQRVQQLKLASLGRLAGSIAHEIRNPLSAISHANGLLKEGEGFSEGDHRLMDIVASNARRMNEIIENVLGLSRRSPAQTETTELGGWLASFAEDFRDSAGLATEQVSIAVAPADLRVRVDLGQMQQVLQNLCENAVQHAGHDEVQVQLVAGLDADTRRPFLDVIDNGPGIPADSLSQLFEPFFTTRATGSGLGLYISRELCEANQATLNHRETETGCCFRITFSDPRRSGAVPA